jgi:hypothetical protein
MTLPSWVKPNTIAFHQSGVLFSIQRVQSTKGRKSYYLSPWANGSGITFPLAECQPATPACVPAKAEFLTARGHRLAVERTQTGFVVTDGKKRVGIVLGQGDELAAARALARAFDGAIFSEEIAA